MINQSGIDPSESAASMNKRDENEPLLVNVKGRCIQTLTFLLKQLEILWV